MATTGDALLASPDVVAHFRMLRPVLASTGGASLLAAADVLLSALVYDPEDRVQQIARHALLGASLEILFPNKDGPGGVSERLATSFVHWLPHDKQGRRNAEGLVREIYNCVLFVDVLLAMARWLIDEAASRSSETALQEETRNRRLGVGSGGNGRRHRDSRSPRTSHVNQS